MMIDDRRNTITELSLFSGCGGGLLGTKYLLGWRTIGYVEIDNYCQRLISQRIRDGLLDNAPIFGNIRAFISEGFAESYKGMVDVITGGFPCQPFSVAGKRQGEADERNLWNETIDCIRIIRPKFALLENVPGLLSSGYFGTILADIQESGYHARWRCLSAAEVGANHRRNRLWILLSDSNTFSFIRSSKLEQIQENGWYRPSEIKSSWLGNVNGIPNRMDRLRAIGNAQVPLCVAVAYAILAEEDIE